MARIFGKLTCVSKTGDMNPSAIEIEILISVNNFCAYAERDNPRFNATKFRRAVLEYKNDDNGRSI